MSRTAPLTHKQLQKCARETGYNEASVSPGGTMELVDDLAQRLLWLQSPLKEWQSLLHCAQHNVEADLTFLSARG